MPEIRCALLRPAWSGPARLLALAAIASRAAATGRRQTLEDEVGAMLDRLADAVRVTRDDLATMQRDLQDGRLSYPIALTARAAELPLRPWPSPAVVLGAMIATGSLAAILDAAMTLG